MITALENKLYRYIRHSDFYKAFLTRGIKTVHAEGIEGFLFAFFVKMVETSVKKKTWVVLPTEEDVLNLLKNLDVLNCRTVRIESTGLSLYAEESSSEAFFKRVQTFAEIAAGTEGIRAASLRAFSTAVPSPEMLKEARKTITLGQTIDTVLLSEMLAASGFLRVPGTTMPGEFSIRGEVVDIFPYEAEFPFRLYIAWETIEKISNYDPLGQETFNTIPEFTFSLAKSGEKKMGFIDSYIDSEDVIILFGEQRLAATYESFRMEAQKLFREAYNADKNCKRPDEMLFPYAYYESNHKNCIIIDDIRGQHSDAVTLNTVGPRSYFGNLTYFQNEIAALKEENYRIILFAGTVSQKQRLEMILRDDDIEIIPREISEGFSIPEERLIAVCDHEIFGRRRKSLKALHHTKTSPLDTFVDLEPGDFVVHINYGIGIFRKIDRIKALGKERDYIQIEYAEHENVFIPIEQANLVQRFIGKDGTAPRLDKIGGTSWETKKRRARKNAEDLADRLIKLYARRKQAFGTAIPKDSDWQLQFEAMFPYEETEDQITCMQDIKEDMEKPIVMDRLICGDVGYGKTELAIRAAFKAVMSGKQVAFLAPTTILAEQHYDTVVQRVEPFPLRIKMLSRLVSPKEQRKSLKMLAQGEIDILIGTHRIIQKDVIYKDLGLLIVDEEQRFGVKDKEKIKELKASVDSLALSATPIPRTLYMSLLKIRDMSLLTTPPILRRAIQTIIREYDEPLVRNAILKEAERGGQVFYLHNRIETLDKVVTSLKNLIPEVSIDFAHGQMDPEQLEDKMRLFVHNGFQVLVATTIIENGIDIPNVNTIIIDRADRYGVSQLYQLRGRVGRSDRDAYAYLLYPNRKALSEIAMKRLKILSEHTELGSGFKIAMKDMEMRGTGNLLGREQSGQMQAVGLDMYLRILDEEISKLSKTDELSRKDVFLDLDYSGYIPDFYIEDASTKFEIYRKIAGITKDIQIQQLTSELEDRFGPVPSDVQSLLYIAELKVLCRKLDIYHLQESRGIVRVEFSKITSISVDRLVDMIRESSGAVSIDQKKPNIVIMKTEAVSLKDKSLFMLEKLQRLM
jgi:transcription-repair coupling factor (superfamily II helicase)